MLKLLLDYDGTLTAEEEQVLEVAHRSLLELADDILHVEFGEAQTAYDEAAARIRNLVHEYGWRVNGMLASYADEGAFIFHTVTLQTMLAENDRYRAAVAERFTGASYDPVAACTNYLFHTHSAPLEAPFRSSTSEVLPALLATPNVEVLVVSSSLGDKVERNLARLDLGAIRVLGDTRQYEIDPDWTPPIAGAAPLVRVDPDRVIDLRRRVYHEALAREMEDGSRLAVVADTLSLPGALPLAMGIPFALLRTEYTPHWCANYVESHPIGVVLEDLAAAADWAAR
ncbi:MAG: hypothetical protein E3J64_10035 [Anaerolineales bacterium]|nr:MAG: hypothetical protein E3J64_10035 [Anaerolineales bacterium]